MDDVSAAIAADLAGVPEHAFKADANPYGHADTTTTTKTKDKTTKRDTTGSTSSAAPVDPVEAQKVSSFQSIYMQLWGEPATEAYLKGAVKEGFNAWEFADHERNKPAWLQTDAGKTKIEEFASTLRAAGIA